MAAYSNLSVIWGSKIFHAWGPTLHEACLMGLVSWFSSNRNSVAITQTIFLPNILVTFQHGHDAPLHIFISSSIMCFIFTYSRHSYLVELLVVSTSIPFSGSGPPLLSHGKVRFHVPGSHSPWELSWRSVCSIRFPRFFFNDDERLRLPGSVLDHRPLRESLFNPSKIHDDGIERDFVTNLRCFVK